MLYRWYLNTLDSRPVTAHAGNFIGVDDTRTLIKELSQVRRFHGEARRYKLN
jgi:hypothetical protein